MKLLRLKIHGFGTLRGEHTFDPRRVTLVVDDNERGKSTLLAALAAALYGLSDDRRSHRPLTPLDRWRPWDGGPFGVELDLECAGERWTVMRDFTAQTVAVWNERGQEVTPQFLDGKDEYPVGRVLLGLDAEEFEKCCFVQQEELGEVVPADERDRRANSLQHRLERAADTRAGNSSAHEALRVLEEAAARYTEPLLDTTIKVENAISRLEAQSGMLDSDRRALEHDLETVRPQLERLATLKEEERTLATREHALNRERRVAVAAEARSQLDRHVDQSTVLTRLEREAQQHAPFATVPHGADTELAPLAARLQDSAHQESRLDSEIELFRGGLQHLDTELANYAQFSALAESDADRFVEFAAEMRRLESERDRTASVADAARRELAMHGFDAAAIEWFDACGKRLDAEARERLDEQPDLALVFQAETTAAEQDRTHAEKLVATIDVARRARAIPGWIALGLAGAAAALGIWQFAGEVFTVGWELFAAAGAALALAGAGLLFKAAALRAEERERACDAIEEANGRLRLIAQRRDANDRELMVLAQMSECDVPELLRTWARLKVLEREREPVRRAEAELTTLTAAIEDVRGQAGNPPDASYLTQAADAIRRRLGLVQQREQIAERLAATESQHAEIHESLVEFGAAANAILARAGLPPESPANVAACVEEVKRRANAARRHAALVDEMIPQVRRHVLTPEVVRQLEQTLTMLELDAATDASPEPPPVPRQLAEIERESAATRARLDVIRREEAELRLRAEEVSRRFHADHPKKITERERVEQALLRARRFKESVDLARQTIHDVAQETHRRWAEFLNQRVAEFASTVGTRIERVRFGEDLDFAVKPKRGPTVSRGKAVRQLSSGARDQLHLAVRLAISEYLSRDEPLPLLIDDCFATSDDQRARAGMKLLVEHFSREHQVVMVTCHRKRCEALAALDWELWQQRVQWMDIEPLRIAVAPESDGVQAASA